MLDYGNYVLAKQVKRKLNRILILYIIIKKTIYNIYYNYILLYIEYL